MSLAILKYLDIQNPFTIYSLLFTASNKSTLNVKTIIAFPQAWYPRSKVNCKIGEEVWASFLSWVV